MTWDGTAPSVFCIFPKARTKSHSPNQSQYPTYAMDYGRSCKIMEHVTEDGHHETVSCIITQPTTAPCPMSLYRIYNQRYECTIYQIHRKLSTFSHRSTYYRGRGSAKNGLENQKPLYRQFSLIKGKITPIRCAYESSAIAAEHKAEAYEEEQERAKHKVNEILHQDVGCVLATCKASLAQSESRLHPENQHGCK